MEYIKKVKWIKSPKKQESKEEEGMSEVGWMKRQQDPTVLGTWWTFPSALL